MKRHVQLPGVRKWSGDDLLELQGENLKVLDGYFSQGGNCVLCGCEMGETSIAAGIVTLGGKVMAFDGAVNVEMFPAYLVPSKTDITREYLDDVVRNIAEQYKALLVYLKPEEGDYIEIGENTITYWEKINPRWRQDIEEALRRLKRNDDSFALTLIEINEKLKKIPTKLSQLENDNHTVQDALYVHTDNSYTTPEKEKLAGIEKEANKTIVDAALSESSTNPVQNRVVAAALKNARLSVPTLPAVPTDSTLTYVENNKTLSFSIGQFCRVYDSAAAWYVFYQLYDITAAKKADWRLVSFESSTFAEVVKINVVSNQGISDTSILGVVITVKYGNKQIVKIWGGTELPVMIPYGTSYQVIAGTLDCYQKPATQTYTAVGGNSRGVTLTYSTEKVSISLSLSVSDGVDCSEQVIKVINTANSSILFSGKGEKAIVKIPYGIRYKIVVSPLAGYTTPAEQTFTAGIIARNVNIVYQQLPESILTFNKLIIEPANITGDNQGVIAKLLSKYRRCLCKKTANGEVTIRYLYADNSNYYDDGTPAKLDGTEGDVMVDFPEFYYKYEFVDINKFRYHISPTNLDGSYKHIPRSLVGVYKAFMENNKLYSRSGVQPVVSRVFTDFKSYVTARGTGYRLIDFQQHCIIALMLYAKYKTRDLQSVIGYDTITYGAVTGTTNPKGNHDTNTSKANGWTTALGLEGPLGGLYEFMDGVSGQGDKWFITDPDGVIRSYERGNAYSRGWIANVAAETGPFFDMIPTNFTGSETTHYADYAQAKSSTEAECYLRAGDGKKFEGGAASIYSQTTHVHSGSYASRLAFRGIIREATSVNAFKALPLL